MNTEQQVYEVDGIWSEEWFSPNDRLRVERLAELALSLNAKTVVDVGCGNGLFLNYLKANHSSAFERLCGVERSESAIRHVETERIVSSIDEIALPDNEFDLVSCQEVIEHLPEGIFDQSIEELGRISNKYILISVPYNENLDDKLVSCPACSTKFHPEYHMRSFTKESMQHLETHLHAKLLDIDYITIKTFVFQKLLATLSGVYKNFPTHTICPMCGYNENSKLKKNMNSLRANTVRSLVKKIWPTKNHRRWIYALYEK